ncbi:hypothetical protein [Selenomonas sp. KH1T6]|uniref:hypothetical protein n=1 Tax=Selenomonas sp. KH1T6 TaxID=3158784 RepID=UPI0008A7B750|nr:hypothetical protein SAMN05216583_11113 [Selenomonas ruminantium]
MSSSLLETYIPYNQGGKARILFLFEVASFWPSWESVYEAFQKDKRADVRLVLMSRRAIERSQLVSAKSFLEEKGYAYELDQDFDFRGYRPHVVFMQSPYDLTFHTPDMLALSFRKQGSRVVYIPYGIEIADTVTARRDHFQNFVVENCWRIYTSSKSMAEEYKKHCMNYRAVRALGSPKFDYWSGGTKELLPIAAKAHAQGRQVVLWKMHFSKDIIDKGERVMITPDLDEYLDFARSLDSYENLEFIFLPHPKILHGIEAYDVKGDDELIKKTVALVALLRSQENVLIYEGDDYRPALASADAIMLDRSGTMVEAAMTGVPVLFTENENYREVWTPPVKALTGGFAKGTGAKDMEKFLASVQAGETEAYLGYKEALEQEFPKADGNCGFRIKEDVLAGLQEAPRQIPRIALYATGRICRYYLEQKDWQKGIEIAAVIDSNPKNWGKEFCGYIVAPPEQLKEMDYDALVIMSDFFYHEIKKSLVYEMRLEERKIWRLDEFVCEIRRAGENWEDSIHHGV